MSRAETILAYHAATRHHFRRYARSAGHMDWANQPDLYKTYPGIQPVLLPREPQLPPAPLQALFDRDPATVPKRTITAEDLSAVLLLTHSLTARAKHPGGDFFYRSTASAGALYPTEIYGATRGVQGLADGLVHFSIAHHGLTLLRTGADLGAFGLRRRPSLLLDPAGRGFRPRTRRTHRPCTRT